MDRKLPFSITRQEEQELRNCSQIFFYGGNPYNDPEIKEVWQNKWELFFEVFLLCIDARYGNFLRMPFEVSVFEQPRKTIQVFFLLQNLYREKLDKDQKAAMKK